jgi:hypothetical protein
VRRRLGRPMETHPSFVPVAICSTKESMTLAAASEAEESNRCASGCRWVARRVARATVTASRCRVRARRRRAPGRFSL